MEKVEDGKIAFIFPPCFLYMSDFPERYTGGVPLGKCRGHWSSMYRPGRCGRALRYIQPSKMDFLETSACFSISASASRPRCLSIAEMLFRRCAAPDRTLLLLRTRPLPVCFLRHFLHLPVSRQSPLISVRTIQNPHTALSPSPFPLCCTPSLFPERRSR